MDPLEAMDKCNKEHEAMKAGKEPKPEMLVVNVVGEEAIFLRFLLAVTEDNTEALMNLIMKAGIGMGIASFMKSIGKGDNIPDFFK